MKRAPSRAPSSGCFRQHSHSNTAQDVYAAPKAIFTIYADRKLQTAEHLAEIVRRFGLADQRLVVQSDAHYRSVAW